MRITRRSAPSRFRGGLVYLDAVKRAQPDIRGVVTATTGNHGQSIALAAARLGVDATIVVPYGNSVEKNRAMAGFGARLVEAGHDFQAAFEHATELAFRPFLRSAAGTSWCAVNFAYLMAEDVRRVLPRVEGIRQATIHLGDHCAAPEIEAAVNEGRPFAEAFPEEGAGSLAALRLSFLRKGFLIRQERLLLELRAAGCTAATACAVRLGEVSIEDDKIVIRQPGTAPLNSGSAGPLIDTISGRLVRGIQVRTGLFPGGKRIRTCMGLFLSSGCFGFC